MKIVTCFKIVSDTEQIRINNDRTLSFDSSLEISQYDLRAVEEAAKLASATNGTAVALTVGGESVMNSKMKKAVLSRGPSQLLAVMTLPLKMQTVWLQPRR